MKKGNLLVMIALLSCLFLSGKTQKVSADTTPTVKYQTHVQDVGWQNWESNGGMSGTSGRELRLEGIKINVAGMSGNIEYQTHVQNVGWQDWTSNGSMSGTSGRSLRLEGIRIRLTGDLANDYDVQYRTQVQNVGWQGWVSNGDMSGTSGRSLRLEGIEIKLVKKSKPNVTGINYQTHVQDVGWQNWESNGGMSGTSGRELRLEGIKIQLANLKTTGNIEYQTHVQNVGWQNWVSNGDMSGTSGRSLRLEGIRIRLTGNLAKEYDVQYRTHVQNVGWQDWVSNGSMSGTSGRELRLEGIEIKLVKKSTSPSTSSSSSITSSTSSSEVPKEEPTEEPTTNNQVTGSATATRTHGKATVNFKATTGSIANIKSVNFVTTSNPTTGEASRTLSTNAVQLNNSEYQSEIDLSYFYGYGNYSTSVNVVFADGKTQSSVTNVTFQSYKPTLTLARQKFVFETVWTPNEDKFKRYNIDYRKAVVSCTDDTGQAGNVNEVEVPKPTYYSELFGYLTYTYKGIQERTMIEVTQPVFNLEEVRASFLKAVNADRQARGLQVLTYGEPLNSWSQLRAEELKVSFSHWRPDGSQSITIAGYTGNVDYDGSPELTFYTVYGGYSELIQNAYFDAGTSEWIGQQIFEQFKSSPVHYQELIDPIYDVIGLGSIEGQYSQVFLSKTK